MTDAAQSGRISSPQNWNPHAEQVIITFELHGKGIADGPYRRILTVWSLDGEKLAESTPTCRYGA